VRTGKLRPAILVASLVLTAVLSTVPTRGAALAVDAEARAQSLAKTGAAVQRQIDRLASRARTTHRGTWIGKRVMSADRRVISLTRGAIDLNRNLLSRGTADCATLSALLRLNAEVLHLDRDAKRLSRQALSGQPRAPLRMMSTLAGQLRMLRGKARDRFRSLPTPTPTPTGIPGAFNAMEYGAKANGVTDDAAAIQRAVDACYAAGGGTVYLPAGTYRLDAGKTVGTIYVNVNVRSGVHIVGDGRAATFVIGTRDSCHPFAAYQQENIGVSSLNVTTTAARVDGVKLGYCSDAVVSDIVAHGLYIGLAMYGCRDSVFKNCIAYDSGTGITISEGGEDVQNNKDVGMTDCEAYNCASTGIRVGGFPPGSAMVKRLDTFYLMNCYAHGNHASFYISYVSNGLASNCRSARPTEYEPFNFYLAGVQTATLSNCPTGFVVTAQNGAADYNTYGESTYITVD